MNSRRSFLTFAFAAVWLAAAAQSATAQHDVLYVGDGDNTVKRFDAKRGVYLDGDGVFVSGLLGPRALLVDRDADGTPRLLVSNQNVFTQLPGEVLAYNAETGEVLPPLVAATDKDAPYVAWGMIRGAADDLYVSSLSTANGKSHGEILRFDAFDGTLLGSAEVKAIKNKDYHPRSMVFGPDGLLYATMRSLKSGLGGAVLRFYGDGSSEVVVSDDGGAGRLNRPDGIVFGSDGLMYVMSFSAGPGDADAIRIYNANGTFIDKIDLFDPASEPRRFGQGLLFGPGGRLYVPISNTGEVRAYDVETGAYDLLVPAAADGGELVAPLFLTFGNTNPHTLRYELP